MTQTNLEKIGQIMTQVPSILLKRSEVFHPQKQRQVLVTLVYDDVRIWLMHCVVGVAS